MNSSRWPMLKEMVHSTLVGLQNGEGLFWFSLWATWMNHWKGVNLNPLSLLVTLTITISILLWHIATDNLYIHIYFHIHCTGSLSFLGLVITDLDKDMRTCSSVGYVGSSSYATLTTPIRYHNQRQIISRPIWKWDKADRREIKQWLKNLTGKYSYLDASQQA